MGENGSGRSTLIEAIADLRGLPVSGGGKNETADRHGPELRSALAPVLRPAFTVRPPDSYFFRAEFQAHFASLLEQRREDPDFDGRLEAVRLEETSHYQITKGILESPGSYWSRLRDP